MAAPKNNQNAKQDETLSSFLHIRVNPKDKAKWVRASKGGKLAPWVIKTLNNTADK
jgi:hypothetical protein